MNEDRLLDRISNWKADPTRRGRADMRKQIDSIVSHLKLILNTRQGNVPIAEDYGIPDLTTFMQNYPDSVNEIETSIRQAIAAYEPRLNSVEVKFIYQEDDILCLRFQITAQLSDETGKNIRIETIVDSDGKISLRN